MRIIQAIILIAFLAMVGLFAIQNTKPLSVTFWNVSVTAPVALLAVAIYLLGMLTGWTVVAFLRRSIRVVSEHRRD